MKKNYQNEVGIARRQINNRMTRKQDNFAAKYGKRT